MIDLFIATGEMSGDVNGAKLVEELLQLRPHLKIGAVAGPHMRKWPIQTFFQMESLKVMGFLDLLPALPKLIWMFYAIRRKILQLNPKAVVCIDYPGLHLRLERSLRKKGYTGKLIHFICPTVWAWGKKRIPLMAQNLDLLLTLFPFEKSCFTGTTLNVQYVGHPLALPIAQFKPAGQFSGKILGLFPGSRKTEIERNLPLQLKIARKLKEADPELQIAISQTGFPIQAEDALIV
ncbi:MAG: lipid-A-disaccharide synthase, partial [Verrucomicrobia bacterium]|nr:lipid-A-disaccharide synthase [Verrucomicrobiota bacterium]